MKEVRLTIVIKRPAPEVFSFALNPDNTPKWIDGITKEEADPLPTNLGTIYSNRNREGEWTEYEITALEPGRMFVLSRRDGNYHVRYTATPQAGGKAELEYIEWVDDGELENPFTIEALQKLKQVMETPKQYLITLKSGKRHVTERFENDEAVLRWVNTGAAGILYSDEQVRIHPEEITLIQRIDEDVDRQL